MWYKLGRFILKFRLQLLLLLIAATGVMAYFAAQVKLSYDATRAVPLDNVKFIEYQSFLKKFGSDGNTVVIGIESDHFFTPAIFNAVAQLHQQLKKVRAVQEVISIPEVIYLQNDTAAKQFIPQKIFHFPYQQQTELDSAKKVFENFPFYRSLLYNPQTHAYVMAVSLNNDTINSKGRSRLIGDVMSEVKKFQDQTDIELKVSGLPYIRTMMSDRIKQELNWFLIASLLLEALTLFIFFRSISTTIMSLLVVGMGVIWSLGTIVLCGYKITLLTALIPPLIVVIGIPNCIYFLNKYHTSFKDTNDQHKALVNMVGRMGIVTLFCNIAAAIGFAVFAFTQSQLLKEFGVVSGINIMALFFISLIFIPIVLSYLPAPKTKHTHYLENKFLEKILLKIERWTLHHAKWVWAVTIAVTVFAVMGIFKLKSEGYMVDDLPKKDKIYTDLKWFEKNFGGVMPLEIVIDTKKKNGLLRSTKTLEKIDVFSTYLQSKPEIARPLSLAEGLKFARQSFYDNDSMSYTIPSGVDLAFMSPYLKSKTNVANKISVGGVINNFMDSNKQAARISVNMKDIGSVQLPILLQDLENKSKEIFDTSYKVTFTGGTVTFLEGSSFIISGLKESIFWAFILIAICMLLLFRSFRILICSLIPNIIPLIITAGVMGWAGISLKPSTVLVFSVALGIVIDVTIRFLVNYKQELPHFHHQITPTLIQTIRHTGISIIYTSLVLIAGFIIFCFSSFGSTEGLGWLTSLTLVVGTLTNLILLPVLIISVSSVKNSD